MNASIPEAEQARRLAAMRAAAPLPPPMPHHPVTGAPLVAPGPGSDQMPADSAADATASAQHALVLPPAGYLAPDAIAPLAGVEIRYHQTPPSDLDVQNAKRKAEIDAMHAMGYDPHAPVPSPQDAIRAFNAGRIDPATLPPPTSPTELRVVLDVAKAALRAARQKAHDAARPVDRTHADVALLEGDIAAGHSLQQDIAAHFANCVAADQEPELDPVLARRVKQRDQAQNRRTALQAALGPLEAANVKAQAEAARAQTRAEAAALTILAIEAEGMAAECVAAREHWAKLRNDLLALGAVRMNGATPKLSYNCFLAVRDEPQPPHLIDALVQQYTKRARALLADDDDA